MLDLTTSSSDYRLRRQVQSRWVSLEQETVPLKTTSVYELRRNADECMSSSILEALFVYMSIENFPGAPPQAPRFACSDSLGGLLRLTREWKSHAFIQDQGSFAGHGLKFQGSNIAALISTYIFLGGSLLQLYSITVLFCRWFLIIAI